MKKRIAVIGSSGGNLYMQGGNNPPVMMKEIFTQAQSAQMEVTYIGFIGANRSMDGISMDAKARLYTLEQGELDQSDEKTLKEINELVKAEDEKLANMIEQGEIDGIISLSSDPKGVNQLSVQMAAAKKVPIAGTGGTSIANIQSLGANVISASGTTGTTNRTRAVAFIAAFAKEWNIKYQPVIGSSAGDGQVQTGSIWKRINFRGIMMAAMPGFIAMAILIALGNIPVSAWEGAGGFQGWMFTLVSGFKEASAIVIGVLPVIIAAIAAKQVSGLDEVGLVAGIVAGILATGGGIIGGLIAGVLAGIFAYYIMNFCLKHRWPGTTANIAAGGIGGLAAGLIGFFLVAPVALWLGNGIKWLIDQALIFSPILAGAIAGLLIWPAIIGGVYHAAILPIVLLEMSQAGNSFLGAIDMCGLVMVSAGITLANVAFPRQKGDRAAALPGFLVNIGFGTFVEAAYPYMFSNKGIFAGALTAATVSGALIGLFDIRGTAYVPSPAAPFVSNHPALMVLCMMLAMAIAFGFTAAVNLATRKKQDGTK